jgi:hypothetical protein
MGHQIIVFFFTLFLFANAGMGGGVPARAIAAARPDSLRRRPDYGGTDVAEEWCP